MLGKQGGWCIIGMNCGYCLGHGLEDEPLTLTRCYRLSWLYEALLGGDLSVAKLAT